MRASLACLLLLTAAADPSANTTAQNRRGRSAAAARTRGGSDYSAITDATFSVQGGKTVGVATICYFSANGCRVQRVEGNDTMDALSKALARLGNEGWTMIGQATTFENPERPALYFVRPRR
jgi:hypothetical protein